MINVAELITDPDFAQKYKVKRRIVEWAGGRFKEVSNKTIEFFGIVQPANTDDLEEIPEADRVKSVTKFFCRPPKKLYMSEGVASENPDEADRVIYDTIIYKGSEYKIIKVADWSGNGYIRAFAALRY
jgi:hypothetical protein